MKDALSATLVSMRLEGCSDQRSRTLDEFYGRAASESSTHLIGKSMLDLIAALRASDDQRTAWGLTSHYRLCLLAADSFSSPWFVIVSTFGLDNFRIEYLMPDDVAPWPGAYVLGEVQNLDEAVRIVLLAMTLSGGWSDVHQPAAGLSQTSV